MACNWCGLSASRTLDMLAFPGARLHTARGRSLCYQSTACLSPRLRVRLVSLGLHLLLWWPGRLQSQTCAPLRRSALPGCRRRRAQGAPGCSSGRGGLRTGAAGQPSAVLGCAGAAAAPAGRLCCPAAERAKGVAAAPAGQRELAADQRRLSQLCQACLRSPHARGARWQSCRYPVHGCGALGLRNGMLLLPAACAYAAR